MCVPESALRYYELELEQAAIAADNGFETWEEYQEALKADKENYAYDNYKEG